MVKIRLFLLALAFISANSCTSINIRPVRTTFELQHVCIENGEKTCFDGQMIGVIRDGFERHSITTQVYSGNLPPECQYYLSYMCERTWDLATYLKHAEMRLYQGRNQIGYAEYHLKGGGGLSLMKWQSTKTKIDPVIDELLSGSKIP